MPPLYVPLASRPAACLAAALVLLAPSSVAMLHPQPAQGASGYHLQKVVDGLTSPTWLAQPAGETHRLFVTEKAGLMRMIEDGSLLPAPFLDLTGVVNTSELGGLVSLAFHPGYAQNGWFYAYYASGPAEATLARYTVPVPSSYAVDVASATNLLVVQDVIAFHHGGGLAFGPDGRLWLAVGDRRLEIGGTTCTAQDGALLVGKLLRLNDDGSIPADNPFLGDPAVRPEIAAFGLRQPFRMAFDALTGDLYIGDVGEDTWEEINLVPGGSTGGQNFGWRVEEGPLCTGSSLCDPAACGSQQLAAPIHSYGHSLADGCCVVGGTVYRGGTIPELHGLYLYADWCSGAVWTFRPQGGAVTDLKKLLLQNAAGFPVPIDTPHALAVDAAGEVYVVDGASEVAGQGAVWKLAPTPTLTADVASLSLAAGGTQHLALAAGLLKGLKPYLVLGSHSGSVPGQWVDGLFVPLALDDYFQFTLQNPNAPPLQSSFGMLDLLGNASIHFQIPPGLPPALAGLPVVHCALVFDPVQGGKILLASNPVAVSLGP